MADDVNQNAVLRGPGGRWLKGTPSPSGGRPKGSRHKLEADFLTSLHDRWQIDGDDIVARVARDDPGKYMEIMARVLPKELAVSVEQKTPGNLEPEAWATLRRVLDLIESAKVESDPQTVFAMIEEDLRARLAQPVESKPASDK